MKVLLQPCSGKGGSDHFVDTIVNGIEPVFFRNYLPDDTYQDLIKACPEKIEVWGMVPKADTDARKEWDDLEIGNWVLFYAKKRFIYSAQVLMKVRNEKLAQDLWGFDSEGKTWEFVFFINNGQQLEVPYDPTVIGYSEKHIIQGASVLKEDQSYALMNYIGKSADGLESSEDIQPTAAEVKEISKRATRINTQQEAFAELSKISNELINKPVRTRISTAKVLARNPKFSRLVKERAKYICELCGRKPFIQISGIPYAEAHHKFEIAKYLLDNPSAAV